MKKSEVIYQNGDHQWIVIARDPDKNENIIDTNEYIVMKAGKAMLPDPGGIEVFPEMFSVVGTHLSVDDVEFLFASHQDPDIASSLPMWVNLRPGIKCYVSWLWTSFIPHFGCEKDTLIPIPDEGMEVKLAGVLPLRFIPAHYLHSAGNFQMYDPEARILFSGDVGAALLPDGANAELFVKDFDKHTQFMKAFHQRWMGSNDAKNAWIDRVAQLKIDIMCPQHGALFKGDDIARFLQWFRDLRVAEGAVAANRGAAKS